MCRTYSRWDAPGKWLILSWLPHKLPQCHHHQYQRVHFDWFSILGRVLVRMLHNIIAHEIVTSLFSYSSRLQFRIPSKSFSHIISNLPTALHTLQSQHYDSSYMIFMLRIHYFANIIRTGHPLSQVYLEGYHAGIRAFTCFATLKIQTFSFFIYAVAGHDGNRLPLYSFSAISHYWHYRIYTY